MKLTDLEPEFLKAASPQNFHIITDINQADGIMFLCPKCFIKNNGPAGTHSIQCWTPKVTADYTHGPWQLQGTGYSDITLIGQPTSSVLLNGGCNAHFSVKNGEIEMHG